LKSIKSFKAIKIKDMLDKGHLLISLVFRI